MSKKSATVVRVSTCEANLKRRLRRHLTSLGFEKNKEGELAPPGTGKEAIRTVHGVQREDRLAANKQFLSDNFAKLAKHFASGSDIDPHKISPALEGYPNFTFQTRVALEAAEAPILATAKDGRRFAISLSGPLTADHPLDTRLKQAVEKTPNTKLIVVNELIVRGNLPAATREVQQHLARG